MKLLNRSKKIIPGEAHPLIHVSTLENAKSKVKSWTDFLMDPSSKQKLPMPIYKLLSLKTEEAHLQYLKSLPKASVETLATAVAFVMLKANLLERAMRLGITVPEKVSFWIQTIETKVKETGELTVKNVQMVVKGLTDTATAILAISFAIFLLMNPFLWPVLLPLFLIADVIYLFDAWTEEKE